MAWGVPYWKVAEWLSADGMGWYEALFALEPWGTPADDFRAALVAHTTASVQCTRRLKFEDFLPKWGGGDDKKVMMMTATDLLAWGTRVNGRN